MAYARESGGFSDSLSGQKELKRGRQVSVDEQIAIGGANVRLLAENPRRVYAIIVNSGGENLYVNLLDSTSFNGVQLLPGGNYTIDALTPWTGQVYGSTLGVNTTADVIEVELQ